jgi:hypothetical protein
MKNQIKEIRKLKKGDKVIKKETRKLKKGDKVIKEEIRKLMRGRRIGEGEDMTGEES